MCPSCQICWDCDYRFGSRLFKTADDVLKFARKVSQNKKHGDATQLVNSHRMAWSKIIQDAPLVTFPSDSLLNLGARASIFHLLANTRPNAEGVTGALGVSGLSSDSYGGMVLGYRFMDA